MSSIRIVKYFKKIQNLWKYRKNYKLVRKFNRHLHSIGYKINQLDNNLKNKGKERERLKHKHDGCSKECWMMSFFWGGKLGFSNKKQKQKCTQKKIFKKGEQENDV